MYTKTKYSSLWKMRTQYTYEYEQMYTKTKCFWLKTLNKKHKIEKGEKKNSVYVSFFFFFFSIQSKRFIYSRFRSCSLSLQWIWLSVVLFASLSLHFPVFSWYKIIMNFWLWQICRYANILCKTSTQLWLLPWWICVDSLFILCGWCGKILAKRRNRCLMLLLYRYTYERDCLLRFIWNRNGGINKYGKYSMQKKKLFLLFFSNFI